MTQTQRTWLRYGGNALMLIWLALGVSVVLFYNTAMGVVYILIIALSLGVFLMLHFAACPSCKNQYCPLKLRFGDHDVQN